MATCIVTNAVDPNAVYTYGWDTAFAIPVTDVNKAIVDHHSSPSSFSYAEPSFKVSADFGAWQVTQGGDGKNIRLALPLKNVQLFYPSTQKTLNFDTGIAIIEVQLHYIPHTELATDDADGKPYALVVKAQADEANEPVVNLIEITLSPSPGTVAGAIIAQSLVNWGNANLGKFAHVFAVVNLNRMVNQDRWAYVTPNYTSYAYLDGATIEDSTFAVLCMTGNRTGENLSEQVDPHAIPSGSVAGFVISQSRTLNDLVRPAIMQAYQGLTAENFLLSQDGTTLYLIEGISVDLAPVQHNGSTYYPKLKNLSITSNGQILMLTSYTETEVVVGITATCETIHWYTMGLGNSSNGQTLVFQEHQTPAIVHNIVQSPGSEITEEIIAIVAAIALLILVILTDGAALIVGGLIIGLLIGADQIVPALIEKINKDDSPSIDLLLVNAVNPIRWPNSQIFKLGYGSLNVSLQLGGDPLFV